MQQTNLPREWENVRLGDFAKYEKGKKPKNLQSEKNAEFHIPYIDIQAFEENVIKNYTDGENSRLCYENDFLMVWDGARAGLVGKGMDGALGSTLVRINFPKINNQYAYYFLQSKYQEINMRARGTGIPHVDPNVIWNYCLPIPPLSEQTHLANLLDDLTARVQKIQESLDKIPALLKTFRQSVLARAVSGELTEFSHREKYKLSEISDFQNGFAFDSKIFLKNGNWQVVRLGNIRERHLFLDNSPVFVSDEIAEKASKFSPSIGDTLISMTGTKFKKDYGFVVFIESRKRVLINQRVGRFIPKKEIVNPKYLNIFLQSEIFRRDFFLGETGGVNQGNVGSKHISNIKIELPILEEQHQIVQQVEHYFALADEIERQTKLAQEKVNYLTQSILAKAFRGELTANWRAANQAVISGENSAKALLAKIENELKKGKK